MNRQVALLTGLGVVLLLVGFYLLAWAPKSGEIDDLQQQIEDVLGQQATTRSTIRNLEDVRQRAPELEAQLTAVEQVIPRNAALPSAFRQLQLAADDSGLELASINPSRPVDSEVDGVAVTEVALALRGSYYQVVDFLRRVGDPAITPRAFLWETIALTLEDYPILNVGLNGSMYSQGAPPAAPAETPSEGATEPTDTATEEGA